MEPQPLPIEEFVDQIDLWKGFFNGITESIKDFEEELARADSERAKEKISLQNMLAETDGLMSSGQAKYVRQLVAMLVLPPEDGDMENGVYKEEHRGVGVLEQDEFMPHVEEFLKNKKYKPESLSIKKYIRATTEASEQVSTIQGMGVSERHGQSTPFICT